MAQRHAEKHTASNRRRSAQTNQSRRNSPNEKHSVKANVIIWGVILAILLGTVIFLTSGYHEQVKTKVQNSQYPQSYSEYVEKSAKEFNLDPALVYSVIRTESNYNPMAQSGAGAYGLMQITEDTLDHYMNVRGESGKYTTEDLFTPTVNIEYGCNILRDLLDDFGNEECAVAAYNAGPGNVQQWLSDPNISPDGETLIVENIPFDETRSYVNRVEKTKEMYKELYY